MILVVWRIVAENCNNISSEERPSHEHEEHRGRDGCLASRRVAS